MGGTEDASHSACILLVEDDVALRTSLALALRAVGYDVMEAEDGWAALDVVRVRCPDIAIVDVGLAHGPDGLAVVRRLEIQDNTGVVFLTAMDASEHRLAAFAAGADDYITKPFDLPELLARLQALLRRLGRHHAPIRVGELAIDEVAQRVSWKDRHVDLSATELALLAVLARHRGEVLSKTRLLSVVWGHTHADVNVVEAHMSRLRRKLWSADTELSSAVRTVHGRGYVLDLP